MKKQITLSIDEIRVVYIWLSNSADGADESPNKEVVRGILKKLDRHLSNPSRNDS